MVHGERDCNLLVGTVSSDSGGKKFCRLGGGSCPTGWTQYNHWSTTQVDTSCPTHTCYGQGGRPCNPGSHSFEDKAVESACSYSGEHYNYNRWGVSVKVTRTRVG
mgnify:CR=1 FL=1